MKKTIRLTESDLHRIVKESVNKVLNKSVKSVIKEWSGDYAEVRSDYYDDFKGATCIDAWKTTDDNEEGEVVAYVYDNGEVEWRNPQARNSKLVQDEIRKVLNDYR